MATDPYETRLYDILDEMQRDPIHRYEHQPEFHKVLVQMRNAGQNIPVRLEELDRRLVDEAVEAQFDNFPV